VSRELRWWASESVEGSSDIGPSGWSRLSGEYGTFQEVSVGEFDVWFGAACIGYSGFSKVPWVAEGWWLCSDVTQQ